MGRYRGGEWNGDEVIQKIKEAGIELDLDENGEDYEEGSLNENTSFIPADVRISPRTVTVDALVSRLKYMEIDLHPEFQRNSNLWSDIQQSRLIESLMLNIPIPSFYFNAANDESWIVIGKDILCEYAEDDYIKLGITDDENNEIVYQLKYTPFDDLLEETGSRVKPVKIMEEGYGNYLSAYRIQPLKFYDMTNVSVMSNYGFGNDGLNALQDLELRMYYLS